MPECTSNVLKSWVRRGGTKSQKKWWRISALLESCTVLVEAFGKAGDPDQARYNFDYMIKLGHKPDDRCTASMIVAYEKKNLLDKALNLLMELEKDGFEPGVATYSGEAPPFKVHISLCDMYARANVEKKAIQALGVLEAKQE
ncbi:hypothetical protein MTR67_036327 [Solanum verrucosum]|uniref:Pentatricopeptide repeat-containing protein n=1 Tax=Solanum verrucosum TaxID=315347 RepID=A0AAF0UBK1_SOLVR|nr:hypothetical protein MTR67_036327 [Solanum verrucosum]